MQLEYPRRVGPEPGGGEGVYLAYGVYQHHGITPRGRAPFRALPPSPLPGVGILLRGWGLRAPVPQEVTHEDREG